MENTIDTPTAAVLCGLIVLIVGCLVLQRFEKAEKADKLRAERQEMEEWMKRQSKI